MCSVNCGVGLPGAWKDSNLKDKQRVNLVCKKQLCSVYGQLWQGYATNTLKRPVWVTYLVRVCYFGQLQIEVLVAWSAHSKWYLVLGVLVSRVHLIIWSNWGFSSNVQGLALCWGFSRSCPLLMRIGTIQEIRARHPSIFTTE